MKVICVKMDKVAHPDTARSSVEIVIDETEFAKVDPDSELDLDSKVLVTGSFYVDGCSLSLVKQPATVIDVLS